MSLGKSIVVCAVALGMSMLMACGARADTRLYLVTYGYDTPVKGEKELEQWTDSFHHRGGGTSLRSRTELEYGVTDRLAAGLYFVNERPDGGRWEYDETKLELRYRITEMGKRYWDTAGYLEIVRPNDSEEPYEMEAKAILSHDFARFNLTLNLIGEKELESDAKVVGGYAIGLAPQRKSRVGHAFELFGEKHEHYIMPSIWWTRGRKNIGLGLAAGLTHDSDSLQIRTLYSVEF